MQANDNRQRRSGVVRMGAGFSERMAGTLGATWKRVGGAWTV